ncbi:MAG: hypothetical protein IKU97_02835 [Tidjanibacter sp.]|nr:hypothetical protein [Tidjanibacter sp.]
MKYIKSLAVIMVAMLTLASCESGNVGKTVVQFADQQFEDGFGSGWIYVPLKLSGSVMNTADVNVSVQVVPTEGSYTEAVEDVDYQITSYDLVFRPGVEEAALEIQLMETDPMKLPDVMEFKLAITSSNTNIGANSECLVHLEKTTADRLCGQWYLSFEAFPNYGDIVSPTLVNITWNAASKRFSMLVPNNSSSVYGTFAISMIFDEENDYIILPAYHFIEWYDPSNTILIAQFQATNIQEAQAEDGSLMMICDRAGDDLIGTYDKKDFQTITFPSSETALAIGYSYVDESGSPTKFIFWGTGMRNVSLSRTK